MIINESITHNASVLFQSNIINCQLIFSHRRIRRFSCIELTCSVQNYQHNAHDPDDKIGAALLQYPGPLEEVDRNDPGRAHP